MQTQITIVQTAPRQWEVRAPDSTPLGTFYDEGSLGLFVDALRALVPDVVVLQKSPPVAA